MAAYMGVRRMVLGIRSSAGQNRGYGLIDAPNKKHACCILRILACDVTTRRTPICNQKREKKPLYLLSQACGFLIIHG